VEASVEMTGFLVGAAWSGSVGREADAQGHDNKRGKGNGKSKINADSSASLRNDKGALHSLRNDRGNGIVVGFGGVMPVVGLGW
jgi:hypothetical protein